MIQEEFEELSVVAKGKILIVDDTEANIHLLSDFLPNWGYEVETANSGMAGLHNVGLFKPDLILLDIKMPDIDGYEVCQQLKANPETQNIPVIFLSALDEVIDKVRAFEAGGVDYITKPLQLQELLVRIENQMSLQLAKAQICKLNAELEERVKERTSELELEIHRHLETQQQLKHIAFHDALTGLPNRSLFLEQLEAALRRIKNNANHQFAVLFLDCDRFKFVNDSFGHILGDLLLVEVAYRLKQLLSTLDSIARFGGDEFSILLEYFEDREYVVGLAERIEQALLTPFECGGKEIFVNVSIGIVFGAPDYNLTDTILRDADTAMYRAKAKGKACYEVFHPDMHVVTRQAFELQTNLRLAIERQEFSVYYQPIISLATDEIVEFEALLRWQHPIHGFISPAEFIPVAEETGMIVQIGEWVLREVCAQIKTWQQKYGSQFALKVCVNLSGRQFAFPALIEQIDRVLADTGVAGEMLKLEITESAIMDNAETADFILKQLKERQIQLCIDDFGTGYSSLSYLHRFPVETLKIDRSFINLIQANNQNAAIVQAIVTLAHQLGMNVVAEGVETLEQKEYLKAIGCEFAQGYYFAKPLPSDLADAAIARHLARPKSLSR
jgi:diguanylate cyclase (GGDEF)-like protein